MGRWWWGTEERKSTGHPSKVLGWGFQLGWGHPGFHILGPDSWSNWAPSWESPVKSYFLARLFSGKEVNESQNMGKTIKPGRQFSHSLLLNSTYMGRKSSFNIPEVFSVQFYNNGWFLIPGISLSLQLTLSWKGLQKKFSLKKKSSPWFFTLSTSDFLTL